MFEHAVLIIPTYNEEHSLASTVSDLEQVFQTIDRARYQISVLIFDSHSTDGTVDVIRSLQQQYANVYCLTEPQKTGLGAAYIQAMQFAMQEMHADIVFEFDADGSHQPKYIPEMLNIFFQGADVVVGSRYIPGGSIPKDWAWHRQCLSRCGNWIARFFLTWQYKDFTSGLRGTRTHWLKQVLLDRLLSKHYAYKIHLFFALHLAGAKIVEIPIAFIDRKHYRSKCPATNVFESLKIVLLLRWRRWRQRQV
ncbi:MAG: polyprenol monophosphomannose synthase [Gammaproteobacteria bacterium]|nr:polyprenol monophosphomannose synthase [Gammaproteobacteria bacterium]